MAEEETEQTEEVTETETSTPDETNGTPTQLPNDHPLVKSLDQWKGEAKELRNKVKEFEDRDKTESERTSEKLSTLERELTTAQANTVRFEIALEKGLTKNQAKRLVGSTREELEADAEELVKDLGLDDTDKPDVARRPQERLKPGAAPDAEPTKSPAELADAVMQRQRGY